MNKCVRRESENAVKKGNINYRRFPLYFSAAGNNQDRQQDILGWNIWRIPKSQENGELFVTHPVNMMGQNIYEKKKWCHFVR